MDDSEVKVTVRPIKNTDFDAVLELAGNIITREDIASSDTENTASLCFVAEVDRKVVGFNLAHHLYVGIPLYKICVIQGIVVHDNYRRLGIGEKLIEAVCMQCTDCGIITVRALVEEDDIRLKQFIEHLGFRKSTVKNYDRTVSFNRNVL